MNRPNIIRFSGPDPLTGGGDSQRSERAEIVSIDSVIYRTAQSRADLAGAFRLLQRRYVDTGLSPNRDATMRVMPYHLWSETQVFVAVHRNTVIGSVSLIRDGHRDGIPMESTYGDAIKRVRNEGSRLGEVCSLSVDSPGALSSGELFGQLTRLMMFQARYVGLEYLVAVVHPRHAKFYQLAMGFQEIGGLSHYNQVGGQPGIPILGSVNDRSSYRSRWRRYYFDGTYSDAELEPRPISPADREFFRQYLPQDQSGDIKRIA